jgi:hypothetical protein
MTRDRLRFFPFLLVWALLVFIVCCYFCPFNKLAKPYCVYTYETGRLVSIYPHPSICKERQP